MKEISPLELLTLYEDTINSCSIALISKSNEEIGYMVYEELDTDIVSFLHENSLKVLMTNGLISKIKYELSKNLWEEYVKIRETKEWEFENFRTSDKWLKVLQMGDKLRKLK